MVLQDAIENLRDRPHRERHTIALGISFAVVVVLLIGWAFFFFRSLDGTSVQQIQENYNRVVETVGTPQDATGWVSEAPTETPSRNSGAVGGIQFIEEGTTTSPTE